ncbi:MAG TPA: MFS transporter [Ktedonobacter sp.]|nr:MFS transporter [Ktedonobacter sp.]
MQVSVQETRRAGGLPYKWIVAIVVIFGIFMSILDSTIVNIAIPRLQTAFGADLNSVQWVLTGYILIQGVMTPLTGFFSDRFGSKRFYIVSLIIFTVGSALCGLAWSLPVLIFFRVLQGLGGAFLLPLSITLLYSEFPPNERGFAIGVLGLPILLAPALGPTVGGYIVTFSSWQFIFYINMPIGILGIILGAILLHENQTHTNTAFDIPGFIFSAIGLGALLYALSDASTDGWGSTKVLAFLFAGIISLIIFTIVELSISARGGHPLLNLRIFGNMPFLTSNIATVFVTFALYGGLFLVPIYLQDLRQQSAFQAGLILLPQAFASMVAVVVGGRLVDRIGVRAVVLPGLIILAIANWELARLTLYTPIWQFQIVLILRGFSLGLSTQPLIVSALSEIRTEKLAEASALNTALRFVASSLGVAVLATLVQTQTQVHFSHIAEQVTPTSPLGKLVPLLQALFVSHGASAIAAYQAAIQVVGRELQAQSYMLAMQDAFWLTFGLCIAAIIAVVFVRSRRTPDANLPATTSETTNEDAQAREEALLAV